MNNNLAEKMQIAIASKRAIKQSIINKGVDVGDVFSEYANAIDSIQTGITPTGTLEITENGEKDVTNYAKVNVNVESLDPSKEYTNPLRPFSFPMVKNGKTNGIHLLVPILNSYASSTSSLQLNNFGDYSLAAKRQNVQIASRYSEDGITRIYGFLVASFRAELSFISNYTQTTKKVKFIITKFIDATKEITTEEIIFDGLETVIPSDKSYYCVVDLTIAKETYDLILGIETEFIEPTGHKATFYYSSMYNTNGYYSVDGGNTWTQVGSEVTIENVTEVKLKITAPDYIQAQWINETTGETIIDSFNSEVVSGTITLTEDTTFAYNSYD